MTKSCLDIILFVSNIIILGIVAKCKQFMDYVSGQLNNSNIELTSEYIEESEVPENGETNGNQTRKSRHF